MKTPSKLSRIRSLHRVGSRVTDDIASEARRRGVDVLPLSAYPRRPLPASILESLASGMGATMHPPSGGLPELREAVAEELRSETGWRPDPDSEILITAGGMHAVQLALLAAIGARDPVGFFTPSYFFDGLIALCGGVPRPFPCEEREFFRWPVEKLARRMRARALILNTPCNPTGVVADAAELEGIAEWAAKAEAVVISDESYDKLVYDGKRHVSYFACAKARKRGLLVRSFTKSYGLPQWRVGFLAGPAELISAARKALEWTSLFGPYLNQKLAAAVLCSDRRWMEGVAEEFQRNRDEILRQLADASAVRCHAPAGNPFLFARVAGLGAGDVDFSRRLIERHGVPNTPGSYHGLPGCLRIPFGGPIEAVRKAGERLLCALRDFQKQRR